MEKYMLDIKMREDGLRQILFQREWDHLRARIDYAMVSAKVTPGIELVSRDAFARLEELMAELPETALVVGRLFMRSEFVWDEAGENLLVPTSLMEYAGIKNRAVLLAGDDFIALCSPETAEKY